jgi:DNA-binding NtrC family response regulator/pSer/pThr/pTyr-binding forkhead associated (FHA) protein
VPAGPPTLVGQVSLLFFVGDELHARTLKDDECFVVGRGEPADLVLPERTLSRAHVRFSLSAGRLTMEDLGSTNGCSINGARVSTAILSDGDVALLGAVELRVSGRLHTPSRRALLAYPWFLELLADEVTRARLASRSVALVALRHRPDAALREKLLAGLGPLERLTFFAPTLTVVLLPERDADQALAWWAAVCGHAQRQLHAGIAAYPSIQGSAEQLLSCALDACHSAAAGQAVVSSAMLGSASSPDLPIVLSPCMLRLYELIARAARTTIPALIEGETGSGKELVARAFHERGPRQAGPFKALNCATIPASLIESTLFGHERGAFTSADRSVPGVFEQAHGGTVFLDEVGELSEPAQAALLRVLEHQRVVRLGGTREIEIDVRVVAATHRDLADMVAAGKFREDLLYRLNALTLHVPPLRERREEILPLAELFLLRARERWGASPTQLAANAREALLAYGWPGNVRQLKNVIERSVVLCAGAAIQLEDLPSVLWEPTSEVSAEALPALMDEGPSLHARPLSERMREFEIAAIREALERCERSPARAAQILGLPRRTLAHKIQVYGLAEPRAGRTLRAAADPSGAMTPDEDDAK